MFTIPEGKTFSQAFADNVALFKQHTSHLGDNVYLVTVDLDGMSIFIICFSCTGNSRLSGGELTMSFSPPTTYDVLQRISTHL
jgi:hypothetical protein